MRNLDDLGDQFEISILPDENGYIGRECPECEQYFKITFGTGIIGGDPICHCPYCGHSADHDQFFTKAQIEYAESIVINKVTGALIQDLKSPEFNHRPKGPFGIGISMKVEGSPEPIRHYSELDLEEEVVCDNCTLRYTIYGTFAYCPDCGQHNSLQILEKNLAVAQKQLDLAALVDGDLSTQLVADALENCVSAFDGFGREACRVSSSKASDPTKATAISFQNLAGAKKNVLALFGVDITAALSSTDWTFACRGFQKRHLLAHKMGIVDDAYIKAACDGHATVGRKISIRPEEVLALVTAIQTLGEFLMTELAKKP